MSNNEEDAFSILEGSIQEQMDNLSKHLREISSDDKWGMAIELNELLMTLTRLSLKASQIKQSQTREGVQ